MLQCNHSVLKKLPKCCKNNQILDKNGTSSFCLNDTFTTSRFSTFNKEECASGGYCLEKIKVSISKSKIVKVSCNNFSDYEDFDLKPTFVKCCHENKVYNSSYRKCMERGENLLWKFSAIEDDYQFVQFGLPDCKGLIIDYFFKDLNDVRNNSDGSISLKGLDMINSGQYCLDNSDNDGYVIRVCKNDTNDCKKGPNDNGGICIRKCCPDGHSYKGGVNCVPTFDHGINVNYRWNLSNEGIYLLSLYSKKISYRLTNLVLYSIFVYY